MKNTSTEKLNLLKAEFNAKRVAYIRIAGLEGEFGVLDVRTRALNVEFQLERRGGRMIVDPDDVRSIRLLEAI